jgi:ElaB/YqjD/DUF883 family membrane-anchored ribosome-binding protein
MPANSTAQPALDDAVQAAGSAASARLDSTIEELKGRASRVVQEAADQIDTLRDRYRPYLEEASDRWEVAERYLVDRVQKQPLTTTFAALGVGVLVGLILAGGRRN